MTVSQRHGLLLIVAFAAISAGKPAQASLKTRLDTASVADVDLLSALDEAAPVTPRTDMGVSSSKRTEEDERQSEERRRHLARLPSLAEHQTTSSAATTPTPLDGGSQDLVTWNSMDLLPSSMDLGPITAFKAMIPPDPPPSGLLKPPRDRIEAA